MLRTALAPGEVIHFAASGYRYSGWEYFFAGAAARIKRMFGRLTLELSDLSKHVLIRLASGDAKGLLALVPGVPGPAAPRRRSRRCARRA